MRCSKLFFLVAAVFLFCHTVASSEDEGDRRRSSWPEKEEGGGEMKWGEEWFLLKDTVSVVKTEGGEMRVVKGFGKGITQSQAPMHIGFITMKPNTLFIPQYLDSSLILFVRSGDARIGHVHKDALAEKTLKPGDIYRIESGSAFYIANDADDQRLDIVCSIDTSESLTLGWHGFLSFFIGGGSYPTSILSGFNPETIAVAFNVSINELKEIMTTQHSGPIVFLSNATSESSPHNVWSKFLQLKEDQRLAHLKRVAHMEDVDEDEEEDEEDRPAWYFRKLMLSVFGNNGENGLNGGDKKSKGPESYNIFDRKADYNNDYGWSKAVDQSVYSPLRHSGMGVYQVSLIAGSMMAPHVNPRATEYGIVLKGTGTIQIVYPNGTLALNAKVSEGDVFWVPRYFPFCQTASRTGPFEFFGFTTSSRKNRPQFLVGAGSLLHTLQGPEIAAAFGVDEDHLKKIIDAQKESIILPSPAVAPPEMPNLKIPKLIKNLGSW